MIRNQIKNLIDKVITLKLNFVVEVPEEEAYGDYATNVALILAKNLNMNPRDIAEKIRLKLTRLLARKKDNLFEKIEIADPGFVNFFLKPEFLQKQVKQILKQKQDYGRPMDYSANTKKKVQVEFISANPTGKLHLGHGRGAFTGDVLANILEKAGYKVQREYYINDGKNSKQIQTLGATALGKGNTYLNTYLKQKIKKLKPKLNKIKNKSEAGNLLAQEVTKDIKNFVEKKLKIKFDNWFSEEKELYQNKKADKILKLLKAKKLIYEKDNAQWLRTSKYGDDKDRVIIRETGEPTYILSDLTYHYNKFKERKFDKVINIWGADHFGYIGRIKAGIKMLGIKPDKLDIIITQLVRLIEKGKEAKMSKRKGDYVTLEELINEVGLDVARFFFLMYSTDRHMNFNLSLAKEKSEKNPVFYIQYAYARINSILKKCKMQNAKCKIITQNAKLNLLNHSSELALIKELIRLPEAVEDTAKDYQVQRLSHYTMDIATAFHRFYTDCRVLGEEKDLEQARLALVLVTKIVLKNILDLMGITAPEKM